MKRRILVTGGAGFIGSHVVDVFIEAGFEVSVVDSFVTGRRRNVNPAAKVFVCDIRDRSLHNVLEAVRPEVVVHHAAQVRVSTSIRDPLTDAATNVAGSINLLEACKNVGVRKVIYASSAAIYGDPERIPVRENDPARPISPYGVSKFTVEQYLYVYKALYGIEYTILRYSNVYGPRQDSHGEGGVVAIFNDQITHGRPCTIFGDGEQTRDFVYVKDVARANLLAIDKGDGEVFNVSTQTESSVNEVVKVLEEALRVPAVVHFAPERAGDIRRSVLSNDKIRKILGWEPMYDLRRGIHDMVAINLAASAYWQ